MPSGRSNLENLARVRQLNAEPPDERETASLLSSAEVYLRDARSKDLGSSSRFALAYNASHALALAALRAAGYRPSSAGHRRIVFQTLDSTANAPQELHVALAQYHDRRNKAEYEGSVPSEAEAQDLIALTAKLRALVLKKLQTQSGRHTK